MFLTGFYRSACPLYYFQQQKAAGWKEKSSRNPTKMETNTKCSLDVQISHSSLSISLTQTNWQQVQQISLDVFLHSNVFQFLRRDPQAFPGQIKYDVFWVYPKVLGYLDIPEKPLMENSQEAFCWDAHFQCLQIFLQWNKKKVVSIALQLITPQCQVPYFTGVKSSSATIQMRAIMHNDDND